MTKNLALLLHRFQRSVVRATGQCVRENMELVIIVNEEIEEFRRFNKWQTEKTRAVAASEWSSTVRAVSRHCPDADLGDLPNPFKASE